MSLVSIIMPVYNGEKYLRESINSVITQSYTNWELVIIDDNSNDSTRSMLRDYESNYKIRTIYLEKNSGAAIARNKGIDVAKGEFIAFLDADDIWDENKLKLQIQFMKDNNYNFTCTAYDLFGDSIKKRKTFYPLTKAGYNTILTYCPVGNSTVIYNCEKLGKIYVPHIRKRNDDALWLQILKRTQYIYGYKSILMHYRIHEKSLSNNKLDLIKYHWILYRKIENLSVLRSFYHIVLWILIKILRIK